MPMRLFKHLTNEEKGRILKVVTKELERYRISKAMAEITGDDTEFHRNIELAVNGLPTRERDLIATRYLSSDSEYLTDQHVAAFCLDPPISLATYATIRNRAMLRIALYLKLDTGVELELNI